MVHYRRSRVSGGTYFFTVALADRRQRRLVEHAMALRRIICEVQRELPFHIVAMVILPEHWHAVWTLPAGDDNFVRRMRLVKARFTRYLTRLGVPLTANERSEFALWQRRYWEHTIRDEHDLDMHVAYIHMNPVKHGLATHPVDWPYSTIHRYVRHGLVAADWGSDVPLGPFGE